MIRDTASMMFLTTRTETEALLLEQNLIKQLKPRYNVLLRDDKSFPNILVAKDHAFPQIKKHRGAQEGKGRLLRPLRQRRRGQPDAEPAAEGVPAAQLLRRDLRQPHPALPALPDQALLGALRRPYLAKPTTPRWSAMPSASCRASRHACRANWRAEMAGGQRGDGIRARRRAARPHPRADPGAGARRASTPRGVAEADVIALHMEGGQACVQVFFIRANQNWGNRDYYPASGRHRKRGGGAAGLRRPVLRRQGTAAPGDPVSDEIEDPDLMAEALTEKAGRKVEILVPQRGEKAELVGQARCATPAKAWPAGWPKPRRRRKLLDGLAEAFGLDAPPQRIEVYDNSHIQGTARGRRDDRGGARGASMKSQYRKFNIKGDDADAGRRFRHDERGADPALPAPAEGRPGPRRPAPGPTCC